jgi:hypothetical protein
MSTKYIGQINNTSFVYPNKTLAEYDVEIVHDLNDNCVSGYATTFSATTITSSSISVSYDITWVRNGAEPFINNAGLLSAVSIHMLAPGQVYYKPWRVVHSLTSANTTGTTLNFTGTFSVTPTDLGLVSFGSGEIYFEIRFIGHRAILPICYSATSSLGPTPTPTPTPTLCPSTDYLLFNETAGSLSWTAQDCNGNPVGNSIPGGQQANTGCVANGTLSEGSLTIVSSTSC